MQQRCRYYQKLHERLIHLCPPAPSTLLDFANICAPGQVTCRSLQQNGVQKLPELVQSTGNRESHEQRPNCWSFETHDACCIERILTLHLICRVAGSDVAASAARTHAAQLRVRILANGPPLGSMLACLPACTVCMQQQKQPACLRHAVLWAFQEEQRRGQAQPRLTYVYQLETAAAVQTLRQAALPTGPVCCEAHVHIGTSALASPSRVLAQDARHAALHP